MAQTYLATIAPGLEAALLEEIRELGGKRAKEIRGGVEFEATHGVFYDMLLALRTANALWLRLDAFRARDRPELYNKARRFGWERLLASDHGVHVRAAAHRSRLIHTGLIAETVGQAIVAHFEEIAIAAPTLVEARDGADQVVLARVDEDRCELSLDATGELLHRRGWRTRIGPAPIRETLAAALLRLARGNVADFAPSTPVVDPMCGSGTLVIEAAQMASKRRAGLDRAFAAQGWRNFKADLWQERLTKARRDVTTPQAVFYGFDVDAGVIAGARHNATDAGVDALCHFDTRDVAELLPPDGLDRPGLVICNPPYGERINAGDSVSNLLERFARYFQGWTLAILLPWEQTPRTKGLIFSEAARFDNGGISVRLWIGRHR